MLKLYEVTITMTALVLAESEEQAARLERDIDGCEPAEVTVAPYTGLPPKWSMSTLVYHDQGGDKTVAQALAVSREGTE